MSTMLTAEQAADRIGISKRTIYGLAAPGGPIPCQRIGRTVRFELADLEAYQQSCRFISTKQQAAGVSRLTASSPDGESALLSYFRKAGVVPTRKSTSAKKPIGCSKLQLVKTLVQANDGQSPTQ